MRDEISYDICEDGISVQPANATKEARAFWGMQRTLVQNLVTGVTEGFTKVLEITGVGYRAAAQGRNLRLQLGYSHDVNVAVPEGIEIKTPDATTVEISAASTGRRSARSPPRSAAGASPSPTRARASNIAASISSAKKARRNRPWRDSTPSIKRAQRVRTAIRRNAGGRAAPVASTARAGTSTRRSSSTARAAPSPPPRRWRRKPGPRPARPSLRAQEVGRKIAERAKAAGVTRVVFDRGGFLFHGRVKALADAAREGGLEF